MKYFTKKKFKFDPGLLMTANKKETDKGHLTFEYLNIKWWFNAERGVAIDPPAQEGGGQQKHEINNLNENSLIIFPTAVMQQNS